MSNDTYINITNYNDLIERVENLEKQHKITVDKKKIDLKETIKTLGARNIEIKLFEGVIGKLKVDVISDN